MLRIVDGAAPEDVLRWLLDQGAQVDRFEVATPSLEEIFLRVVGATPAPMKRPDGASGVD